MSCTKNSNCPVHGWRAALGPLLLPCSIFLIGLLLFSSFRVVLTLVHLDRLQETENYFKLFPVGLRMDVILLSYLAILPTALLLLVPKSRIRKITWFLAGYMAACVGLILYMEISTFPFMEEYDQRPDGKFIEYLKHSEELFTTLWKVYKIELIVGLVALLVVSRRIWRLAMRSLELYQEWTWRKRLLFCPVVAVLLLLGARSSIGHRPANISTAAFSTNHLANELALNSTFTLFNAIYRQMRHEKNPARMYGNMEQAEVFARVSALLPQQGFTPAPGEIPFLRTQLSPFKLARPMNVVIFLQESVGASDVGCLGGADTTPNLCALRKEGLWFEQLYATGTRTARGIEATLAGFFPTASRGVIKLEKAKRNFFNAASLFKKHGYATEFHYGGLSTFDEMKGFCLGNGFDKIYDQENFVNPVFQGTWGVSDEDIVRRANETFKAHGDKPFFALMLSTSNHPPFEFPDGRIKLHEEPKATHYNAVKYADYAVGLFFELAKQEEYFKNTLFLVVADHNANVRGNDLVPITKFHIPGLLIGPNVTPQEFSLMSSQVDLLPTILHFTGLETTHPMVGRNLMNLPSGTPGRAIMQFADNNAYQVADQVLIQRPFLPPLQFRVNGSVLEPVELNPEMAKDALAFAHLPWLVYSQRLYRLP